MVNNQMPIEIELKVEELVHEYRQYKISVDSLMEDIQEVKQDLRPLLEDYGEYRDGSGYARIVEGSEGSYVRVK